MMFRPARLVVSAAAATLPLLFLTPASATAAANAGVTGGTTCAGQVATLVVTSHSPHVVYGTTHRDVIAIRDAGHVVRARGGNDWVCGSGGYDRIYGGSGWDHIYGQNGNDYLYGGWGDDHLYGGYGSDHLYGGHGHDWADGGYGYDYCYGGWGYDNVHSESWDGHHMSGSGWDDGWNGWRA